MRLSLLDVTDDVKDIDFPLLINQFYIIIIIIILLLLLLLLFCQRQLVTNLL